MTVKDLKDFLEENEDVINNWDNVCFENMDYGGDCMAGDIEIGYGYISFKAIR